MGVLQDHALGRLRRCYAKAETTFGVGVKPAAADAFKLLSFTAKPEPTVNKRADSKQTRSLLEEIVMKKAVTWSGEGYLLPSGTAGTAPDLDVLLKLLLGTSTNNPGVSQVYTPADGQQALGSATIAHELPGVAMERLLGAWIEQATIKVDSGSEPRISFEGGAADYVHTGTGALSGAVADLASSITIDAATRANFQKGSVVKVGTSDGAGAGHELTAYDRSTGVATVSPTISGAQGVGAAVVPFVPAESTLGSPIAGISGDLTIAGTSIPIVGMEATIKNNIRPRTNQALVDVVKDITLGDREVNGVVNIELRKDLVIQLGKTWDFGTQALVATIGNVAGKRWVINCANARFSPTSIEAPESGEEATVAIPFVAKATGAGANEIDLTLN